MPFLITDKNVGRNGIRKSDINKWGIVCPINKNVYLSRTKADAREMLLSLREFSKRGNPKNRDILRLLPANHG